MKIKYDLKYLQLILVVFAVFKFESNLDAQHINDASFVFAKKLYNDKLYDLAAEQFHQFADINFEHVKAPESLLMAGKCYIKIENYDDAKKELIALITKYPDANILDQAQFLLAECFEKKNEFESAAKSYHQVQVFYPESPLATGSLIKSSQMSMRLKQYDAAKENLYHLIEFYPLDKKVNEARLLLVVIYDEEQNYKQALLELTKLISFTEKGSNNASALFKKGHIEFKSGHLQVAEEILNNVLEKYESSKNNDIKKIINNTYNDLADIARKKGFLQQSVDYLMKIHNFKENNTYVFKIANNYFSLENYSSAIEFYKIISENTLQNTYRLESFFQLGQCYAFLQDFVSSTMAFDHVIEFYNDSLMNKQRELCKKAFINASENHIKNQNPNLAVKYLKDYLKIFENEKNLDQIVFRISSLYNSEIGNIERAIRSYYDFLDNYPLSKLIDDAQFNLAQCFEKKSAYRQAVIEYQKLINNYPASDYVDKAVARKEYISTYFNTNKDVLNQFGKIIRQLTETQENTSSLFDLGFMYYKELKDYSTAKNLFKKSYSENTDRVSVDIIIYYLGRCYQLLGEKQELDESFQKNYLDSAYYNFDILLENIPKSKFADDASFYQVKILEKQYNESEDSSTVEQLKNKLTNFRYKYNNSNYINNVNLMLANLLIKMGIKTSVDSMDIHHSLEGILNRTTENSINDKAMFSLALFYYEIGEMAQAEEKLKNIIKNFPKSSMICEAYSLLAQFYENNGDYNKAVYYLKYIVQHFYYSSCSEKTTIKIANLLKKQNKYSEAGEYYQKLYNYTNSNNFMGVNNFDKDNQETIIFNLASISINKNQIIKAIQYFDEYISKYPQGKYADLVLFQLGKLHFVNNFGLQKKAIDYFQRIENDFAFSDLANSALVKLGDIYFEREDYESAFEYYAKYMKKNDPEKDYSIPFSQKIVCLYRMGKTNQGDNEAKKFKKKFKNEVHLLANLQLEKGDYYLKTKNLKLAEKVFKDVKSDYKNTHNGAKAEYLLGKLNFILNKDEAALEIMSKLIERYPEDKILPDVYLTLGNFYYLQAKQIEHALLSYKKATEQIGIDESKLKIALSNLIKCYSDLQMREKALSSIRKYLLRFPTADDIFAKKVRMGILYYELKEFDLAINLLKKLRYEADIENEPRIQYWIGECYFGKGEFKRAVSEYLKVVYLSKPTKLNWRVTAQYQAGIAYVKAGEPERAIEIFEKIVVEQGAGSVFAKPAQKKIDEISELIK